LAWSWPSNVHLLAEQLLRARLPATKKIRRGRVSSVRPHQYDLVSHVCGTAIKTKNQSQTKTSEVGIMTRNLMTLASRTMSMFRSSTPSRRRLHSGMSLENLEGRLSLSAFATKAAASVGAPFDVVPRKHAPAEVSVAMPAIKGQHVGSAAIQGNHIGTSLMIQGNHIGFN
jgi:hypothetical protein